MQRLARRQPLFLYDLRGFVPAIPQGLHSNENVAYVL
jgi:hypothetical protein